MISTSYEGREYSYTEAGWVDNNNICVSTIMQSFLSRKAISEGAEPAVFVYTEKMARVIEKPKKKESPKNDKYHFLRAGIKLFD